MPWSSPLAQPLARSQRLAILIWFLNASANTIVACKPAIFDTFWSDPVACVFHSSIATGFWVTPAFCTDCLTQLIMAPVCGPGVPKIIVHHKKIGAIAGGRQDIGIPIANAGTVVGII